MIGLDNRAGPTRALTPDDERRAVGAVRAGGSVADVARGYGIHPRTLHRYLASQFTREPLPLWRCPVDGTPLAMPWEDAPDDAVRVLRLDAKYCSPRCRQAASRHRRGVLVGWGGTTERRERRRRARERAAVTGQEDQR